MDSSITTAKSFSFTILVVRDDPNLDRYFLEFGERFGFEFSFCSSISDSFIKLESSDLRGIFWFRPVDDVLDNQTLDELRSIVERTSLPILVTVSKEELSELDPFVVAETGIFFLVRPFEPIELVSFLSGICRFYKPTFKSILETKESKSSSLLQPCSDPVLKAIVKRAERELRWASTIIRATLEESNYLALSESDRQLFFRHIQFKSDYCVDTFSDLAEAVEHGAGGRPAILRITNLERIIFESVGSIAEIAQQQGIHFAVRFDRPVPKRIVSDGAKLHQALRAILCNALSGTVYGRVELRVDYDQNQQILVLRTCDTGSGAIFRKSNKSFSVIPEKSDHIEEVLLHDGIIRTGLSVISGVARSLGGEFLIETIPDIGTTARLAIPAKKIPGSGEIQFVNPEIPPIFDKNPLLDEVYRCLSGNVLIGIKDRVHERIFRSYLAHTKLDITSAHTGDEVRQALYQKQFDLLFIDIELSFEGGKIFIQQLRQMGVLTPIIALISSPSQVELERCIEFGCDAFLTLPILLKPLSRVLALNTVGGVLRSYSVESQSEVPTTTLDLTLKESIGDVEEATKIKEYNTFQSQIFAAPGNDDKQPEQKHLNDNNFFGSLAHQCKLLKLYAESHSDYKATGALARELANLASINKEVELEEHFFALEAACLQGITKRINAALSKVDLAVQTLIREPLQKEGKHGVYSKHQHHLENSKSPSNVSNIKEPTNKNKLFSDSDTLILSDIEDILVSTIIEESPELVPLIIEFLDSLDVYLERLKAAIRLNDWPRLQAIAHECAGVASMYGYNDLARLAEKIQDEINRKDVSRIGLSILDVDLCIKAMKRGKEKLILVSDK
jgi:DNA-binding response OmpR family regulator/HPt (histidine-containing phosphotransfer) domain-containing protein